MKIRRVESLDQFLTLAPAWAALARESGQTSPFLSHEWFTCCWRASGSSRRVETLVVEDSTGPVGLVPLARWRGVLHRVPVRFVGMLDAPDTPFVDWLTVGRSEPIVEAVLDELVCRQDWDVLALSGFPADSVTLKALEACLAGRFRVHRMPTIRSPYVDVSGTWNAYWTATSQRFKKTVRSVRNRLGKAGQVRVEEHREIFGDSPILQEVIDVSRRSWKADENLAIANMPGMAGFFRELTEYASRNGWLRLWLLRLDGRAVATEYQLEAAGRVHALRADFDASLPSELSPGTHLSEEILRSLFERPTVHEYDMGPGDNSYKLRWAASAHENARLFVFRPGIFGAGLQSLTTRVVPTFRRLFGAGAPR
jgi:CelD/BcsL family acetyltransferase involved in cellulose biosynthesis